MTIFNLVRPHETPVLGDAIIEGSSRARDFRERERAKLKLIRPRRFPRSHPTITVNAYADTTVGCERNRVLCLIVWYLGRVITAAKLHKLPRGSTEIWRCILQRALRLRTVRDRRQKHRQQERGYAFPFHVNVPSI